MQTLTILSRTIEIVDSVRLATVHILTSRYASIVAVGLLLRLAVMPFTIGFDITEHTWIAHFVAQGHLDVYRYYYEQFHTIYFLPDKPIYVAAGFPPLFYLIDGLYLAVLQNLHVLNFLNDWQIANLASYPTQNRVFFLMKALYIPFDLVGLIAFLKSLPTSDRKLGAWAWMFNPATIYVSYVWGQTDIMAGSFVMIAIYLAKNAISRKALRDGLTSCIALGISASFKLFPLALLPILSLILSKGTRKSALYFVAAGLSPFLLVIPFISKPFLDMMVPYGGFLMSRNLPLFDLPQFTIYVVFAMYLAVLYHVYLMETDHGYDTLLFSSLAVFTLLYGFSLWAPNWILWGMPLILLAVFRKPKLFIVYTVLTAAFFVFVQAWGNGLWLGMFRPMSESLLRFPNLWDLIPNYYRILVGLAYTVFGASMIFVTYYVRVPSSKNRTTLQSWQWPALILIPVSFATGTLILGLDHLTKYGLPLLSTVRQAIVGDPWFFAFYTVIVCATLLWAVMVSASKARREGG